MTEFGVRQASRSRLQALASLLPTLQVDRVHLLEVGSYEGESALFWSRAIEAQCGGGSVTCVDPWRPYLDGEAGDHYQRMDEDLRSGAVYRRFLENAGEASPAAPIAHYRGTLREAVDREVVWAGGFHVVYLDGNHAYERVREDIALARILVREGGILCGDDLEQRVGSEEEAARVRLLPPHDYVAGMHPGVSLAVWEAFGSRVWAEGGAWAVRKTGGGWEAAR